MQHYSADILLSHCTFAARVVGVESSSIPLVLGFDEPHVKFKRPNGSQQKLKKVPVIRVFGISAFGQQTCINIHGFFPFFYVPLPPQLQDKAESNVEEFLLHFGEEICQLYESSSWHISNRGRNLTTDLSLSPLLYSLEIVVRFSVYGYSSKPIKFIKITVFDHSKGAQLAQHLNSGLICGQSFQPYEVHIPHVMQFLETQNVSGCDIIYLRKFSLREPLPPTVSHYNPPHCLWRETFSRRLQLNQPQPSQFGFFASTAPGVITEASRNDKSLVILCPTKYPKLSKCEVEIDVALDDILNSQLPTFNNPDNKSRPGFSLGETPQETHMDSNKGSFEGTTQQTNFVEEEDNNRSDKSCTVATSLLGLWDEESVRCKRRGLKFPFDVVLPERLPHHLGFTFTTPESQQTLSTLVDKCRAATEDKPTH